MLSQKTGDSGRCDAGDMALPANPSRYQEDRGCEAIAGHVNEDIEI